MNKAFTPGMIGSVFARPADDEPENGFAIGTHDGVVERLEGREHESLEQLKGSMSRQDCPDRVEFERGNYMKIRDSCKPSARDRQRFEQLRKLPTCKRF